MVGERQPADTAETLRARCAELETLLSQGRESDRQFLRQVLDINPHLVFAKDRSGRFTLVNQALAEAYGTTVEGLIGKTDADFNRHPAEVEQFRRDDLEVMDNLHEKFISEEKITDASGRIRWLQTIKRPIVGADGRADQVLGVATDITRHKELEQQLVHAALHDGLTGLPNRVLFTDRLAMAVESASRSPSYRFAVVFVDLDRFKVINDSLGHTLGDQLLVAAAQRFVSCVRPGDTVARLGGDEFTLLLTGISGLRDAVRAAECIQGALAAPFLLEEQEIFITASVGVAVSMPGGHDAPDLLRDADTAMYRAKALGRGQHVIFDPDMHERAVARLRLENDLRRALDRGEMVLVYQPIVRVADCRIVELEALLRWQHPERGRLEPGSFLSVAEETGIMLRLEAWVLLEACSRAAHWYREREGREPWGVSLNLSPQQLGTGDPAARILAVVESTGLPPALLRVEITESAILDRFEEVAEILGRLRRAGIRVDVDDFGTGYSSLSYLHSLPVDRLKIDRSFVERLASDGDAYTIAQTIVMLAQTLDLEAIAEGVETAAQLQRVRKLGCTHAQGHFFATPVEAGQVLNLPDVLPGLDGHL